MTEPLRRLLIVLPNWVGDAVMATPALRALRQALPGAQITAVGRASVLPVLRPCPWVDRWVALRAAKGWLRGSAWRRRTRSGQIRHLRRRSFDAALIFPNSFRSAWTVWRAGVKRRIGYQRDGRSLLLSEGLEPPRQKNGEWEPVSAVDYYLKLAALLGADASDRRLELAVSEEERAEADALLRKAGVDPARRPVVLLNPGAATKGAVKLWPAERFGELADRLHKECRAQIVLNGAPAEREILDRVKKHCWCQPSDLPLAGGTLRLLRAVIARCDLVVSNDTGARHVAGAVRTPVVSLFGPTDPCWAQWDFEGERLIVAPSQGEKGERPMSGISVNEVTAACAELLQQAGAAGRAGA